MEDAPCAVLSNGLCVANLSSPHPFQFTDGTIVLGCSAERANTLKLDSKEVEHARDGWTDIELTFIMNEAVRSALEVLQQDETIQIVLVPLPVLSAMKLAGMPLGKARVIRIADRVTKTVEIAKFCV